MDVAPAAGAGVKMMRGAGKWWWAARATALFWFVGGAPRAHADAASAAARRPTPHRASPRQSAPRTWLLIITGVSGETRFAAEFQREATALRDAAVQRFGVPDSLAIWLAENPTTDPKRIAGTSNRAGVEATFARIAAAAAPNDRIFVVLIGHGSSEGDVARFNVPGPDLTDTDFKALLDRLGTRSVVFVNTASASGAFVKSLSGANRAVVAATKSGMERNQTVFAKYFVQAYTTDGADADKDGRVSLLEAFRYAKREVEREYEQENKLLTEHAVLDDDGDGVAHADASEKGPDGVRARAVYLGAAGGAVAAAVASDPRAAPLLAQKANLEASLDSLRAKKTSMKENDYQAALEALLLKLAETNKALRDLEGKKP